MSNSMVGAVYAKIIDDVINSVRMSFEEEGAQPNILEDFKKGWQNKISQRKVAQMPWDPPPAQAVPNPNSVPPTRPQPYTAPATVPPQSSDVKVKTEPGTPYDLQNLTNSSSASYAASNATLAVANASQELRKKFGEGANASIQQLHRAQENVATPQGQKRPLPAGSPTQENPDSKRRVTEYNTTLQAQANQKIQELSAAQQRQPTIGAAQTDGVADWKALVAERMAVSDEDIRAADQSIMDLFRAQSKAEEGNGVMKPISAKRTIKYHNPLSVQSEPTLSGQVDGIDDDEDEDDKDDLNGDADAINSDLDDDDDEQVDSDDDEDPQQLIVCTYEKVARVKNKWKCTLRDGILITGGQEYVFAKATGEFEW